MPVGTAPRQGNQKNGPSVPSTRSCPMPSGSRTLVRSSSAVGRARARSRSNPSVIEACAASYNLSNSLIAHIRLQSSILLASGPTCPACHTIMGRASMQAQLETQIREHIGRYYEGWTVCDDPTCGNRTRMMGVYGRRCLRQGCRGTVAFEVSGI